MGEYAKTESHINWCRKEKIRLTAVKAIAEAMLKMIEVADYRSRSQAGDGSKDWIWVPECRAEELRELKESYSDKDEAIKAVESVIEDLADKLYENAVEEGEARGYLRELESIDGE